MKGLASILQMNASQSAALSCRLKDICRCGIWSSEHLAIIDIEKFVEIGGNNCAV